MSIGNLKDQGNKGNNFPYQLAVLKQLLAIESAVLTAAVPDRELTSTTYDVIAGPTAPGVGYSIGDVLVRTDIISTISPYNILGTIWFNETTQVAISTVNAVDIQPAAGGVGIVTVTNAFNLEVTQLLVKTAVESLVTSFTPVVRVTSMLRVTGGPASSVAAGVRAVSFYNSGTADALVMGAILKQGEQISFDAGAQGDTLNAISYDTTTAGSELLITKIV